MRAWEGRGLPDHAQTRETGKPFIGSDQRTVMKECGGSDQSVSGITVSECRILRVGCDFGRNRENDK